MKNDKGETPRQLIDWAAEKFDKAGLYYGHGTDNSYDEAAFLILRGLGLAFDVSEEILDQALQKEQRDRITTLVNQRITTRKPAAYLLGEAWFAGMPFFVNEDVLVPRSPIAELITERFSPWCLSENVHSILDIGTGSGCIAIACAVAFPEARVDAVDISDATLKVAARNVEHYELQDRVSLIKSDLFHGLAGKKYDLVIANPPYVDDEDMATLPDEYRHEPALGLYAGKDGLDIVNRILASAAQYMTEQGILVVEVGNSQYALTENYPDVPFIWLEFEKGGEGIFMLSREELLHWFC